MGRAVAGGESQGAGCEGISGKAPPATDQESGVGRTAKRSTAIEGERGRAEQILKGPSAGQMEADAAGGGADAGAKFEQLGAQGFDLGRAPGLGQVLAEEVDEVVGGAVQEQAESIGQEAMATEAVGAESVFKFLDAVLALAAIVVEGKDLTGTPGAVGHDKAQVGSGGGVFGLVADAALMRPGAGAVAEAGEVALRELGAAITPLEFFL